MRLATTVAVCAALLLVPVAHAAIPLPADFETWVNETVRLRHEARDLHDAAHLDMEAGRYTAFCAKVRQEAADMTQAADYAGKALDAVTAQNAPELADYQNFKADNDKWASDANSSLAECSTSIYVEDGRLHQGDHVMSAEWQTYYDAEMANYEQMISAATGYANGAQQAHNNGDSMCSNLKELVAAADYANQAAAEVRDALTTSGMTTDTFDARVAGNNSRIQPWRDKYSSDC